MTRDLPENNEKLRIKIGELELDLDRQERVQDKTLGEKDIQKKIAKKQRRLDRESLLLSEMGTTDLSSLSQNNKRIFRMRLIRSNTSNQPITSEKNLEKIIQQEREERRLSLSEAEKLDIQQEEKSATKKVLKKFKKKGEIVGKITSLFRRKKGSRNMNRIDIEENLYTKV